VGEELGDIRRVLPACQRLLQDAVSQTSSAHNFIIMLGLLPAAPVVLSLVMVWVLPRFQEIFKDMMPGEAMPAFTTFFFSLAFVIMLAQLALFLVVHGLALCYAGGPRLRQWTGALLNPLLDALLYRLPWRRRRMQRDFAAMLALLLDAGVKEERAVELAAGCTTNRVFLDRAVAVKSALRSGQPLDQALQRLDDTGEFRWRLLNARHSPQGFMAALAGWLESLDAKAYQQEQAAAQVVSTVMVGLNGLLVGMFAIAMFLPLIKMMEMVTW
jgi:type II secretory pathway component PulF